MVIRTLGRRAIICRRRSFPARVLVDTPGLAYIALESGTTVPFGIEACSVFGGA